jgi:hypothetical protein
MQRQQQGRECLVRLTEWSHTLFGKVSAGHDLTSHTHPHGERRDALTLTVRTGLRKVGAEVVSRRTQWFVRAH